MRKMLLGAIIAACVLSWPAQAQTSTTIMSAEIEVRPDQPAGQCIRLPKGQVTATIQADASLPLTATRFVFGHSRPGDDERILTLVASQPSTHTMAIRGGIYCYFLAQDDSRPSGSLTIVESRELAQYVSVNLSWAP